jgi:hypothetical protein
VLFEGLIRVAALLRGRDMNDQQTKDDEPTVQLPKLPIQAQEFDPDKTVVVDDWSQISVPNIPSKKAR